MVKKKKTNLGLILLLAIVGLYLLSTTDSGLFAIVCSDIEPTSISNYDTFLAGHNGSMTYVSNITVPTLDGDISVERYSVTSDIGDFSMFATQEDCDLVVGLYGDGFTNTDSFWINDTLVAQYDGTYYWCNRNANVAMYSTDLNTTYSYLDSIIYCYDDAVNETNETVCVEDWDCSSWTLWSEDDTCGNRTRTCIDVNNCTTVDDMPVMIDFLPCLNETVDNTTTSTPVNATNTTGDAKAADSGLSDPMMFGVVLAVAGAALYFILKKKK